MIRRLLESYKSRQLDPVEYCRQCLTKQSERAHFNAFITVTEDLAMKQAGESSLRFQGKKESPRLLEGVPIAVKDNFSTKGVRTTCASRMLDNYVPPFSASAVRRLEAAGAVLVGKTNMDEFAMGTGSVDSFYGPVRNPWSDDSAARQKEGKDWLVTGGSSGGSGAAVACGVVLGALGSDTGGSTRSPGAMMGIVGYKPSYGLFSRHGLIPLVNSMDCVSILAGTVQDCAVLAQALLAPSGDSNFVDDSTLMNYSSKNVTFNPAEDSRTFNVKNLRVGIPREYVTDSTSVEVLDAWQEAVDRISGSGGAKILPVSMPHTQFSISAYSVLCAIDVASNMARYDGLRYGYRALDLETKGKMSSDALMAAGRAAAFGPVVRSRILAGNYFLLRQNYEKYVKKAMAVRKLVSEEFDKAWQQVDILLTPLLPIVPETSSYNWFNEADNRTRVEEIDVFTQPANLAGVPAISVPIALKNNWPRSVQILAPRGRDRLLLGAADWLYNQYYPEPGSNLQPRYYPLPRN